MSKPVETVDQAFAVVMRQLEGKGLDADQRRAIRKAMIEASQASYRRGFRNGCVSERALEKLERKQGGLADE